jgi:YgiT-type zinc finger domain-containing protein
MSIRVARADLCEFCAGKLVRRRLVPPFRFRGRDVNLEGVEARVCSRCGEVYYSAEVYKRLRTLTRSRASLVGAGLSIPGGRLRWRGRSLATQSRLRHA